MDSFSTGSSGTGSPQISTDEFRDQMKAQLAQAYAQEFLEVALKPRKAATILRFLLSGLNPSTPFDLACLNSSFSFVTKACLCRSLLTKTVRGKCFEKCISKPGTSLSGSESSCISRCVDRYIEATGIVGRALFTSR
ncbi:hypothetical protein GOBAR_AA12034 [Gossypium barbadense]|uniref:Mitochondrial import inner membrane translocase subunit n=1 Tax=Gossypium barbadense TaxID=3634 RepID=A0A2P5XZ66_GOSBA|nr:hypothetical protein GOBAR_AA12034 [Gossypium barbadense]